MDASNEKGKARVVQGAGLRVALALSVVALGLVGNPAHAFDPAKGRQLFSTFCAGCHGVNGVPVMPGAPNFANQERLLQPDSVLLDSIKSGKNAMPAFQGALTDNDMHDVIAFLRTLVR
jgi:cytochrome c6